MTSQDLLRTRMEAAGLAGAYHLWDNPVIARVLEFYKTNIATQRSREPLFDRSIETMADGDVTMLLKAVPIDGGAPVWAVWMAERAGVEMRFGDFCARFSMLWNPSSDDVLVVLPDFSVLLDADHEERLSAYRFGV